MKTIIANYKMHLGVRESVALARGVLRGIRGADVLPEIVVCPSYPALAEVRKALARSHVRLGAQNVAAEAAGAVTGEVSAAQLADVGCAYTLVGHSERRRGAHETDADVHAKIVQLHAAGITPVVCVGESAEQRANGSAESAVRGQVLRALEGAVWPRKMPVMFAYEPVWAIGSGQPATVADVLAMHRVVRQAAADALGVAEDEVAVLYGGSVDGENAYQYLREREVRGVLVGSASIKMHEFLRIVDAAIDVVNAQQ